MYSDILVPVSTSGDVEQVIDHVNEVASDDATLHLLHVMTATRDDPEAVEAADFAPERELGEEIIDDSSDIAAKAGYDVRTAVASGSPHKEIVQHADDVGADILVMAPHGRTGVKRLIFGSVTEWVIRNTNIPVVSIPRES